MSDRLVLQTQSNELSGFDFIKIKNPDAVFMAGGAWINSSRSGLALRLAERINGVVINADSMQVYKDVPTLTATTSSFRELISLFKLSSASFSSKTYSTISVGVEMTG